MDKIIVYLDDSDYARHQLAHVVGASSSRRAATHWVLVACPPRMTRHLSKWVNHTSRENWRRKWSEKIFAQITPELQARGDVVSTLLASSPLTEMTRTLLNRDEAARVLDLRRPRFGNDPAAVTPGQPGRQGSPWAVPGAVAGMGALLVLATE
ncbi:MAG: hypothetical protein Q8R72_09025 [Hylemonella sp.]|nr:hypothetical protein [Hylemonella sp.]